MEKKKRLDEMHWRERMGTRTRSSTELKRRGGLRKMKKN
jgi:hypothetical protein